MRVRLLSFVMWAAVAASAVFWMLRLGPTSPVAPTYTVAVAAPAAPRGDLTRVLAHQPVGHRYLLPDVCLSEGRFLDGTTPAELPRPVEVVATDGMALRTILDQEAGAPARSACRTCP